MTCVAGVIFGGHVYLGADSAGVTGWSLTVRADPKVFRKGEFVFGFMGSFRMGQILQHEFSPPAFEEGQDLAAYMCTAFVSALRAALRSGGFATVKAGEETGGNFLVGVRGRLFEVESDYQVGETVDGYAAIGCGADVAKGALHASGSARPYTRLTMALLAAERHSAGVRGPFKYVDTEGPGHEHEQEALQ